MVRMLERLCTTIVGIHAVSASQAFAVPVGKQPGTPFALRTETAHHTNVLAFYIVLFIVVLLMTNMHNVPKDLESPWVQV